MVLGPVISLDHRFGDGRGSVHDPQDRTQHEKFSRHVCQNCVDGAEKMRNHDHQGDGQERGHQGEIRQFPKAGLALQANRIGAPDEADKHHQSPERYGFADAGVAVGKNVAVDERPAQPECRQENERADQKGGGAEMGKARGCGIVALRIGLAQIPAASLETTRTTTRRSGLNRIIPA